MISLFNNIFPSKVVTFVSRRPNDFFLAPNQNDLTDKQKKSLSNLLGFKLSNAVNIRQVHGDRMIFIPKGGSYISPKVLEEADGIFTDAVNIPIVIRTADCVPIFLYDPDQERIGIFHAGWQGAQKQILFKGLKLMKVCPENVKIAFGPAIRECCYEVGIDVAEHFPNEFIQRNGKYYVDPVKANKAQAIRFGVKEENIEDCHICTCCDEGYFSYRRGDVDSGRNISLMMLKEA